MVQLPLVFFVVRSFFVNGHGLPALVVDGTVATHAEELSVPGIAHTSSEGP